MKRFLAQAVVTAIGLALAAYLMPGVSVLSLPSLAAAAVLLGLANAFVRPILAVLTLPVTILTLGLFLLIVNAATIGLVASVLRGFEVDGLLPGIGVAIVTGLVSWVAGAVIDD
jgi:putative membrane protein